MVLTTVNNHRKFGVISGWGVEWCVDYVTDNLQRDTKISGENSMASILFLQFKIGSRD